MSDEKRLTNDDRPSAGTDYVLGELARAFATAAAHEDAATRRRADERGRRWAAVLRGMLSGTLRIGSRTPVADLPVWVTPEVVRGGFATGGAAAGGAVQPDEGALARRLGVPAERRALFAHHLTERGLAELTALLDSGAYRVALPEHAALPVVAWLLRAGDRDGALAVLEEIGPYADRLRFSPFADGTPDGDPEVVWRETAADARETLARRPPNPRVEAQREALTVWNPFADELLALWCETVVDGVVTDEVDDDWLRRASALLHRYERLAAAHTRCGKHRRPKENLAILRAAVQEVVTGRALGPRTRGLLQHAVDAMLRRRGLPGSAEHAAVRAGQAAAIARPTHHQLARILVRRLAALPPRQGIADLPAVLAPTLAGEDDGVPAGTAFPDPLTAPVRRALAGTVGDLVAARIVASAEVLATLVPQIAAATAAAPYRDDTLRRLMAATYRAFRNRRSLLLRDLERQVQLDELPWVRAVRVYRAADDDTRGEAHATLRRLGELAIDGFPATLLPNPLVRELATLSREAGANLPWVSELAADIFEGTFSATFVGAAEIAADLLRGTLYSRYYDIDYDLVRAAGSTVERGPHAAATSPAFDALCRDRAGARGGYSVAANGTVIEQAQIITTHNLATLVARVAVRPSSDWSTTADRAFAVAGTLAGRLRGNPRPLGTIKDIAYAWRHLVFYLSLCEPADVTTRLAHWSRDLDNRPGHVRAALAPALAGLAHVAAGNTVAPDGTAGTGRRLLGWTTDRHWMAPRVERR
ncbi:hypothetical protein [Jidongwangia harbinensis]|uniref:hypothetical protein n=1 Tax=Jidongwangia harbinensis TaxID=2878561 RepID=UPI001CD9D711|nr:hypothetical protein [Jidongwangia harbinensis]MCA2217155.1 hypothetical protein [Jidongwangia harbinensis]